MYWFSLFPTYVCFASLNLRPILQPTLMVSIHKLPRHCCREAIADELRWVNQAICLARTWPERERQTDRQTDRKRNCLVNTWWVVNSHVTGVDVIRLWSYLRVVRFLKNQWDQPNVLSILLSNFGIENKTTSQSVHNYYHNLAGNHENVLHSKYRNICLTAGAGCVDIDIIHRYGLYIFGDPVKNCAYLLNIVCDVILAASWPQERIGVLRYLVGHDASPGPTIILISIVLHAKTEEEKNQHHSYHYYIITFYIDDVPFWLRLVITVDQCTSVINVFVCFEVCLCPICYPFITTWDPPLK